MSDEGCHGLLLGYAATDSHLLFDSEVLESLRRKRQFAQRFIAYRAGGRAQSEQPVDARLAPIMGEIMAPRGHADARTYILW